MEKEKQKEENDENKAAQPAASADPAPPASDKPNVETVLTGTTTPVELAPREGSPFKEAENRVNAGERTRPRSRERKPPLNAGEVSDGYRKRVGLVGETKSNAQPYKAEDYGNALNPKTPG